MVHFWLTFIGANITFGPFHFVGLNGMPRRIPDAPDAFMMWNMIASYGSWITAVGIIVFIVLMIKSRRPVKQINYNNVMIKEEL